MPAEDAIQVPSWDHPDTLGRIEDRVDSALSSANSILNFVLAPVRGFVGLVLHAVFGFADLVIGWVYGVVYWVFSRVENLAGQARNAIARVWSDTVAYVNSAVGGIGDLAHGISETVTQLIGRAVSIVYDTVRGWFDNAIHYASAVADGARALIGSAIDAVYRTVTDWFNNAIHYASAVADGARALVASATESILGTARRWVDDAVGIARGFADAALDGARHLVDGAIGLAEDALGAVRRDVLDPLVGRVESFIRTEWAWAFALLKLVEDSAEWISWVGSKAVPEMVAVWRFFTDDAGDDIEALIAAGRSAVKDQA